MRLPTPIHALPLPRNGAEVQRQSDCTDVEECYVCWKMSCAWILCQVGKVHFTQYIFRASQAPLFSA